MFCAAIVLIASPFFYYSLSPHRGRELGLGACPACVIVLTASPPFYFCLPTEEEELDLPQLSCTPSFSGRACTHPHNIGSAYYTYTRSKNSSDGIRRTVVVVVVSSMNNPESRSCTWGRGGAAIHEGFHPLQKKKIDSMLHPSLMPPPPRIDVTAAVVPSPMAYNSFSVPLPYTSMAYRPTGGRGWHVLAKCGHGMYVCTYVHM